MYNFNNNHWPGNRFTFHPTNIPPPPPPPKFFIPSNSGYCQEVKDKEVIQALEFKIFPKQEISPKRNVSISQVFQQLKMIIVETKILKDRNEKLRDEISSISEEEWKLRLEEIEKNKLKINEMLGQLKEINMNDLKHLLCKRAAKRSRMRRVKREKKMEIERREKEMQERSRKIDENLQKIKDEVLKAKQEEEAKVEADVVLKEVLRKKHDAKKCITKLDALMKLRKARWNTMRGRGESLSETEATSFDTNIDKLKQLWKKKLAVYDKEELELRKQLEKESEDANMLGKEMENRLIKSLEDWRSVLFGGSAPQMDFRGDITRFVEVRSQWDRYISTEGTSIPVGWVPPAVELVTDTITL